MVLIVFLSPVNPSNCSLKMFEAIILNVSYSKLMLDRCLLEHSFDFAS